MEKLNALCVYCINFTENRRRRRRQRFETETKQLCCNQKINHFETEDKLQNVFKRNLKNPCLRMDKIKSTRTLLTV